MQPTARELMLDILNYRKVDRMPVIHWAGWRETRERWLTEGLPKDQSEHAFFNAAPMGSGLGINVGLFPEFKEETIEETAAYRIFRQNDGVIAQHWKEKSCIPHFIDFTLKDRDGWAEYKKRLQPDPARIPADFKERIKKARASGTIVTQSTAAMIGWVRNWMGVENMAYLSCDDRDLFREMAMTIADLVVWALDQIPKDVQIDAGWGWEDICFRTGPLVSPEIFKDVAVPGYRKIADKLHARGTKFFVVDCDGYINDLVPLWLESGVNVMFPIEIGAWKADPADYRKRYGKDLLIYGGVDKLEFEKGPAAIDAEIKRRVPLMKQGGFIPLPDHLITPDTSLVNYQYYLEALRKLRF
ncbi:MAG: uroporphyrinogen decarboxylase family protein [Planctomycetota bacterium]